MDHDNDAELFRGYLCDLCNIGIGKLGDDIEGVKNAVRYLEMAKERQLRRLEKSNLENLMTDGENKEKP